MRRSDFGTSSGQNGGLKGENSAKSKTCKKKRSTSISTPNLASSEFLPVYFVDLKSLEERKKVAVHFHSIQERFSGKKMQDKIQTIATKESNQTEISDLSQTPVKFASESDMKIMNTTNSASLCPLKKPVLSTCSEQGLNLPQHKSTKKSSKRGQDDDTDTQILSLEVVSKTEIISPPWSISKRSRKNTPKIKCESVSKLVSDIKKDKKHSTGTSEETKLMFCKNTPKQEKWPSSSLQNDIDVSANSLSEKQEKSILDKSKGNTNDLPANLDKITSPHKEKCNNSLIVVDTSTPKSTTKNKQEFFPNIGLSPELSTPKSSRLPFLTGGFVTNIRQRASEKYLDHSAERESSFAQSLNESMNESFNSTLLKVNTSKSYNSDKGTSSADLLSNLTFSSNLENSSRLETPKTPEAFNSTEMQQWKSRRGMSDVGPRSYKRLSWRHSAHSSSNTLHASLLDMPPYARHRERLLGDRHILPKQYSYESLQKYNSFQRGSSLAKSFDWKSAFLNKCWALKNNFIDSHCHLDFLFDRLPFDGSFQKYYRNNLDSFPCNFAGCVAVFCDPKSFTFEGRIFIEYTKFFCKS